MTNGKAEDKIADGMRHLAFAVKIAIKQLMAGRHFVLEHPKTATSWETRIMGILINIFK